MKKLFLLMWLFISFNSYSTGIPTVDAAAIAQTVQNALQQAQQALEQLNALKEQIEEAKNINEKLKKESEEQLRRFEGNWGLGNVFVDPTISSYLNIDDWKTEMNDSQNLSSLREKFGVTSKSESFQKNIDSLLVSYDLMQQSYEASTKRAENIVELAKLLNEAKTPQEKEDLNNRLAFEIAQNQIDKTRIDTMAKLLEQQDRLKKNKMAVEFEKFYRGK
ncbi:hypothetical protein A9G07_10085 [Gilliamella sp. wkB72]|uniref:type IV secretion system protein n=1 Tax=Gilliamella sp. wkB72 TaxID=3120265 RepID=UPI0008107A27|nr:type IV secretion system protein [Gilliamella apicola]OCL19319.1 hypothetical protein A9G07_10085 [Gilliamella apicola]